MQSLMEIVSATGAGNSSLDVVSVKRKKTDLRLDRTEITNSPPLDSSGCEISSCSTLRKMTAAADDDIGEDGDRNVFKLVEACFSRETTPPPEICADTDEMELLTVMKISADRRKLCPNVDIQTAAEIEEFFSAAEKEDQMKFMNKYNFDVVKDVPLAGRYEWFRIKP